MNAVLTILSTTASHPHWLATPDLIHETALASAPSRWKYVSDLGMIYSSAACDYRCPRSASGSGATPKEEGPSNPESSVGRGVEDQRLEVQIFV